MFGIRRLLALAFALVVLAPTAALAIGPETPQDMALGDPAAKVKVFEYASLSCPHCAHFNNEVFPAFKAKYIDTGKVRYVYREFYTEPAPLAAAGAVIARCAPKDKYFAVIDTFFRGQEEMYKSGKASVLFTAAGAAGGLNPDQVEACLKDKPVLDAANKRVQTYIDRDKISFTPSLFVNGKLQEGDVTLDSLSAAIDPLLKPARHRR